jgi:hypothetical protein
MMTDNNTIDMNKYYTFRKEINKLYNTSIPDTQKLYSNILQLRDKYKYIECIDIELDYKYISIEFEEGTSDSDRLNIVCKITEYIRDYISSNTNLLDTNIINDKYFNEFINSDFYDFFCIGNTVRFNL